MTGYINGAGTYDFGSGSGTGVGVVAGTSGGTNAVIVQYNSDGAAQWVKSVSAGPSHSQFAAVKVDGSGNLYAAGTIQYTDVYDFGTGSGTGVGAVSGHGGVSDNDAVIVKYNSAGEVQWAHSTSAGAFASSFTSISLDSSGNCYASGSISSSDIFDFGSGSGTGVGAVSGTYSSGTNAVVVKYNSAGEVQWAHSTSAGAANSTFSGVRVDSTGAIDAVGAISGTGTYDFGSGSGTGVGAVTGKYSSGNNAVIKKYLP